MAEEEQSLVNTPTWVIASTCAIFIVASLIAERTIYFVGYLLVKFNQTALQEAFEKVKQELMMVGFISIALTLGQSTFANICVPTKWTTTMLLCGKGDSVEGRLTLEVRALQETEATDTDASDTCKPDHSLFMPAEGFHQLHILIFILATVHVVYTVVIVALGIWTVSQWKVWEARAHAKQELSTHDGVRLTRETTFMRAHRVNQWMSNRIISYVVSFFRQFHNIVSETNYHTLRNGFIKNHMPRNTAFNFHKYIRRSLQDDFKHVVGISPGLWAYAILWLLLNVDGWTSNIIVTAIPLILVLAIGTKMQHIIFKMAIRFNEQHPLTIGLPNVTPNDKLFWFSRPRFILMCIHFILFQNALEVSFDVWAAIVFPADNCLYQHASLLVVRIVIGIIVQMLLGLITIPVYALVSQMGSTVKKAIFEEHIRMALTRWRKGAKLRVGKAREDSESSSSGRPSGDEPLEGDVRTEEMVLHNFPEEPLEGHGRTVEMVLHNFPDEPPEGHGRTVEMVLHNFPDEPLEGHGHVHNFRDL